MVATENRQKRCTYCGRYYNPDPRVRRILRSRPNVKYRVKRKRES